MEEGRVQERRKSSSQASEVENMNPDLKLILEVLKRIEKLLKGDKKK